MSDLNDLYEELIIGHSKTPRNFRVLDGADFEVEGYNPLCGDQFTVYLKIDGDKVTDIAFQGKGCAISKASASVMTQLIKGKSKQEANELFQAFHSLVTSPPDSAFDEDSLGKLAMFAGVRKFPVRVKCATLAWHTMHNAIEGKGETATTE